MESSPPGLLEGWEQAVMGMAAVVGWRTCGERGCRWGWMSPFALVRLRLNSSLLSCSVHTIPSPCLHLLWKLLRALLAFAGEITGSSLLKGWFVEGKWKSTGESGHVLP